MGYKSSFLDNAEYGADDINEITKRLVSAGVADIFENGVPYNTTKINDIVQIISHSGVVPESVNTCKVENIGGNAIKINKGVAFFENGTTIEIDVDGVILPYVSGVKNYVYLKSDLVSNKIEPLCTTDMPTGDYVMLAEIESNETVTDKRKYAKGKLPGYQSNANGILEVEFGDTSFPSDTYEIARQIYYTPGEYSKMFVNIQSSAKVLVDYDIANDKTYWIRYWSSSTATNGTGKRIFLYTSGSYSVSLYLNFIQNSSGMLFTLERDKLYSATFPAFKVVLC